MTNKKGSDFKKFIVLDFEQYKQLKSNAKSNDDSHLNKEEKLLLKLLQDKSLTVSQRVKQYQQLSFLKNLINFSSHPPPTTFHSVSNLIHQKDDLNELDDDDEGENSKLDNFETPKNILQSEYKSEERKNLKPKRLFQDEDAGKEFEEIHNKESRNYGYTSEVGNVSNKKQRTKEENALAQQNLNFDGLSWSSQSTRRNPRGHLVGNGLFWVPFEDFIL